MEKPAEPTREQTEIVEIEDMQKELEAMLTRLDRVDPV